LPDDPDLPGLSPPSGDDHGASTLVRHDPAGLHERWSKNTACARTREITNGEQVLLSVDHDPDRGYLLRIAGIGAALISPDGLDVRCAPDPDGSDWQSMLVGQVLPLVATIRGLEVFHAAGVVRAGSAYLLCAPQGVGKTSLAAHLVADGAGLLSDDVIALDDRLVAHPGAAVLYVRVPELEHLGHGPVPGLRRLGTTRGRAMFVADLPAAAEPLAGIYFLERERIGAGSAIEPIARPSPLSLLGATFNLSVRTPARLTRHLELCARLAESVPLFRVRITPDQGAAELARALSAHIDAREAACV
jgi:hypothetical protein